MSCVKQSGENDMPRKRFLNVNEPFVCENCGGEVPSHFGGSCRNHCPFCLWSKHVDKEVPGDRKEVCQGLMEPIGLEVRGGEMVLTHRCRKCGHRSNNKAAPDDNTDELVSLSTGGP